MNNLLAHRTRHALALFASISLFAGLPLGREVHAQDFVKKTKVTNHKVKVKTIDGKAKIKNKADGTQKVKVKGPNGCIASDIAHEAAGYPVEEERGAPFYQYYK
jgi:hypothetical protein